MKTILKTEFGSTIYGTSVPTSDKDFKSIVLPEKRDIILCRAKDHFQDNTKKDNSARNTSSDVDHEMFSVKGFFKLLAEGQTPALDVLFSPETHHLETSPTWPLIQENRKIFLSKNISAMVGYTKQQAAKYGVKGFRVHAVKATMEILSTFDPMKKLFDYTTELHRYVLSQDPKLIKWTECKAPNGLMECHLEVCDRKIPMHASVKYALEIFTKIHDNYGHRAKLAEQNNNLDYKALYHAIRVSYQTEELLLTGTITFPRPEKELLLKVRRGELAYAEISEMIESRLDMLDKWQEASILPEKPDMKAIEELQYIIYEDYLYDGWNISKEELDNLFYQASLKRLFTIETPDEVV